MKKILLTIIALLTFLLCASKLNAIEGYTTEYGVRVRTGAGVGYNYVTELETNTTLDVVSSALENVGDSDCYSGWYKINYNGSLGYVCGLYVSLGATPSSNANINTDTYEARISESNVYVRIGAGYSYDGTLILPGTNVNVIGNKVYGGGCADGWNYIKYNKNKSGYVCSTYIKTKNEITASDSEYEQILRNAGFPNTYIPYLVYLHKLHPSWQFNAIQTNLYWDNVVSGESWKNYLPLSDDIYTLGLTNESGWYYANDAVNAFYIDPRNFLTENYIFMFQTQGYNYGINGKSSLNMNDEISKQYYNLITNMLQGSYLNTDEYKMMYMNAAYTYNISPIQLVSRSVQEGVSDETYAPVRGNVEAIYNGVSVYGYYNFYNIGANGDAYTSDPVLAGLGYACGPNCGTGSSFGRPWDSREKAIYGGAQFLADKYVNDGQQTTYFQKFNTNPACSAPPYTYQYMTNVLAPTSEAERMYYSYKDDGVLNDMYVFDIPIYLNMPESISLPSGASTVNALESITVNGKTITGFNSDVLEYIYRVTKDVTTAEIGAVKIDSKSSVTGTGKISLDSDEKSLEILVTSESGSVRKYKLTIIKVEDTTSLNDILGKLSVKVNNNIMYYISPSVTAKDIKSSINKVSPNATVTINDKEYKGVSDTSILKTGMQLTLSSPSGEVKTYNIAVTGDTNGDGVINIIDLLKVQKHILGEGVMTGEYFYASDTNGDGKINIIDLLRVQKVLLGETSF